MALAVLPAIFRNLGDPIHHKHWRFGKLRISLAKKLAAGAFEQIVSVKTAGVLGHRKSRLSVLIS
jgi:hypothetical protein